MAIVTGGASGIGLGLARALGARGMRVVLADIDLAAGMVAAEALRQDGADATAVGLDIRDADAWAAMLEDATRTHGPLAVLCANAGVAGSVRKLTETSPEALRWTMDVNLIGAFNAIHLGAPLRQEAGGPTFFMATASLAPWVPSSHNGAYAAASKAAVISLCESLRAELRDTPVGVSLLAPGLVKTNLLSRNAGLGPSDTDIGAHGASVTQAMETAASADHVGKQAVARMLAGDFWIFPDPVSRSLIQDHSADILRFTQA